MMDFLDFYIFKDTVSTIFSKHSEIHSVLREYFGVLIWAVFVGPMDQ